MRYSVIIILIATSLFGQVDWFGYYEAEADYARLPESNLYFGYNKFRLDMDAYPTEHIRVGANLVAKNFNGSTTLNFMEFIDSSYWPELPVVDETGAQVKDSLGNPLTFVLDELPYQLMDTLFLDNVFLELRSRLFDLRLGRQQIPSGVGYAWNPTDIFNIKDMMDPTYENTGVEAAQLEVPLGSVSFTGIIQPEESWKATTQYYQLKTGVGRFDLSVLYGKSTYSKSGLPGTENYLRDLAGFNLEGEIAGVGVRSEIAVNSLDYDTDSLKYEFILGGDYTFENSLYVLGEFYHNGFGAETEEVCFDDFITYMAGERKSLNRNYFFGMAMYPLGDLITGSVFTIANLDDGSLAINPQIDYNIFEDVELSLMVSLMIGEDRDEFGYQSTAARLRLRAYF